MMLLVWPDAARKLESFYWKQLNGDCHDVALCWVVSLLKLVESGML